MPKKSTKKNDLDDKIFKSLQQNHALQPKKGKLLKGKPFKLLVKDKINLNVVISPNNLIRGGTMQPLPGAMKPGDF
jgi:hypothetical protein